MLCMRWIDKMNFIPDGLSLITGQLISCKLKQNMVINKLNCKKKSLR